MLTIDALNEYGADTKEGIARCMGLEDFYLQLVETQMGDANFAKLEESLDAGDVKAAFDAAHALKGALGNLELEPLTKAVTEITERLRGAEGPVDVSDLMPAYKEALEKLKSLL